MSERDQPLGFRHMPNEAAAVATIEDALRRQAMAFAWVVMSGDYADANPHAVALTWEAAEAEAQRMHDQPGTYGRDGRITHDWLADTPPPLEPHQATASCARRREWGADDCSVTITLVPLV